jgi:hypothetical protein
MVTRSAFLAALRPGQTTSLAATPSTPQLVDGHRHTVQVPNRQPRQANSRRGLGPGRVVFRNFKGHHGTVTRTRQAREVKTQMTRRIARRLTRDRRGNS